MKSISDEGKEDKRYPLQDFPEDIMARSGSDISQEDWLANGAQQRLKGDNDNSSYRMGELDEVIGDLHHIENTEIGLIALIGKVPVLLPEGLAGKLGGLVGKRIGILRYEGYHMRCLDGEKHA